MPSSSPSRERFRGPLLVVLAAMLWGTTGTAQALAPPGSTPPVVGALRLAVGGLALLALAAARGNLPRYRGWRLAALCWAVGGIAAYQLTFFAGVARTGVAVGTMVGIGSSPVTAGLLDLLVRRQRPGGRWLAATLLAVSGCILLLATGDELKVDPVGILLAVTAGAAYAIYTLALKVLLEEREPNGVIAVVFCLGALLLAPLLVTADLRWLAAPQGVAVILHLGLVATALSYWLFARGLERVPASTAVTLALAEPLTAGVLGIAVLGERLTEPGLLGIGLLLAGLALLALAPRQ
jgi:DME family drug/metabolite transporter